VEGRLAARLQGRRKEDPMPRLVRSLFVSLALLALAGCGGGASPSPVASLAGAPSAGPSAAGASAASSAAASAAAGAGCAPAAAGATAAVTVTIKDFKYSPEPVQAKVGDVVSWKNDDSAPHTATLEDDSCSTETLATGATGALTFGAAGTYTYKCKIHPGQMKGFTVVVS
jgi:plastocyanin